MVCPYCASNNIVTIQGQSFCVNCGKQQPAAGTKTDQPSTKPSQPATVPKVAVAKTPQIIKRSAATKSTASKVALSPEVTSFKPKADPTPAPKPVTLKPPQKPAPKPVAKPRTMSDIKPVAKPKQTKPEPVAKPAAPPAKKIESRPKTKEPKPQTQVPEQVAKVKIQPSRITKGSGLVFGLTMALIATTALGLLHISRAASPGGFFSYLAARSSHANLLIAAYGPLLLLLIGILVTLILWQDGTAIFATSRLLDHRPPQPKAAYQIGWNSVGPLLRLWLVGFLITVTWLAAAVGSIKIISLWMASPNLVAAIGVAVSAALLTLGLWLMGGMILGKYWLVLSGQTVRSSIAHGFGLAKRFYITTSSLIITLTLIIGAAIALILASAYGLTRLVHQQHLSYNWAVAGVFVLTLIIGTWISRVVIARWTRLYRRITTAAYETKTAVALRSARTPQPVSWTALVLSLGWWILVTGGVSLALWHWRIDPTPVWQRLSTTIY